MYVVYINLLYFCRFFCLLTIKIFFPKKKYICSTFTVRNPIHIRDRFFFPVSHSLARSLQSLGVLESILTNVSCG